MVKHRLVEIPTTNMTKSIASILEEEGFIESFTVDDKKINSKMVLFLKYKGELREPVIEKIERISKPGLRVYANSKKLPQVLGNLGIAIMSTSKGVMTNVKAKELGIGGEVLCYIW
jgi:small subunit ribosomal protein S8